MSNVNVQPRRCVCANAAVELCREMRHHGISLMIVSQDPLTIATELLELSTIALIHRCTSIAWLRHLQRAIAPLKAITAPQVAALTPEHALIWARDAADPAFQRSALPLDLRPRVTNHGGHTILAVDGRGAVRRTAPLLLPPPTPALELAAARVPSLIDIWMDAPETALLARTTRSHYATNARRWARWTAAEQQSVATLEERRAALRAYQQRLRQEHPARTVSRLMTGARQFAAWLDRQDAPPQECS